MLGLELVVALGGAVLACGVIAPRLRLPPPLLLLACGVLVGFIPALHQARLPPQVVLLVFLPPLLYWEAISVSLRLIRRNLRGVVLLSTLLVALTAWAAAAVAHGFGLGWGPAWVLGAAVAPTDATAVAVMAKILPRRFMTILRAESLVNDGTALVIYGVAVAVTAGQERLSALHVSWLVLLAYVGGLVLGTATAWVVVKVRARLRDSLLNGVTYTLAPFIAFLLAREINASGVLAVVACGLTMTQLGPWVGHALQRRETEAFWLLATYLLNGTLFVLIGVQAHAAIGGLAHFRIGRALVLVLGVLATLVAVRLAFLFASMYAIRMVDRRPAQRARRISDRARVVSGLCGFRGAVSLAAVLGVPRTVAGGGAFPDRDVIIFVAFGVITGTLAQGLVLSPLVRWARLQPDTTDEAELRLARSAAAEAALAAMPGLAAELGTDSEVVDRLHHETREDARVTSDGDQQASRLAKQYAELRLALLATRRKTLLQLHRRHRIDDVALAHEQERLDNDELRLAHQTITE